MRKLNFLIVDDIFMNRLLLREIVNGLAKKIIEAENGKEAIQFLENEEIDIILMDIEMPVMNGIETTKHIRTYLPDRLSKLPIIALTAHNPDDFFDDFNSAGFDELLTKPYSFSKIRNVIENFDF